VSMLRWLDLPFRYRTEQDFEKKLYGWVSDVLYDQLPHHGFEIREEQIFTAYHMAHALCKRGVAYVEAGSGTGKSFAYILASVCYARLRGKPVVIACASTALQEQLTGSTGDIATLSRLLDLNIEAKTAKDPSQHLCSRKADSLQFRVGRRRGKSKLLRWAAETRVGDRAEVPDVDDELWALVAWDETLRCERCPRRGYCCLGEARTRYHSARDLVVCSHELFFRDLWTNREMKAGREMPYLPDYSAIVFDEGHMLELPVARTLGTQLKEGDVTAMLAGIEGRDDVRVLTLALAELVRQQAQAFFRAASDSIVPDEFGDRLNITRTAALLESGRSLAGVLDQLQDEMVIDESMNEGTAFGEDLASYQQRFDDFGVGLEALLDGRGQDYVYWWEPRDESLHVVKRGFRDVLHRELASRKVPMIFTSATLTADGSFRELKRLTGFEGAITSRVGVPFDIEKKVIAYIPRKASASPEEKAERVEGLLEASRAGALVLAATPGDVAYLSGYLRARSGSGKLPYEVLVEGEGERRWLTDRFSRSGSGILIGSTLWEGIDVPGQALRMLIIYSLPFPHNDPLIDARRRDLREAGQDPRLGVDIPEMVIRLRQGFGRLIRTQDDWGAIAVLDTRSPWQAPVRDQVVKALPAGLEVTEDMDRVHSWFKQQVSPVSKSNLSLQR